MLSEFVTRVLVLLLGYAYPAFECFKAMEMRRVHIDQLYFWCQYCLNKGGKVLERTIYKFVESTEKFGREIHVLTKSSDLAEIDLLTLIFLRVIIAILTVFEWSFDIFVSWLPLYSESKLAFILYLWHPRTQGTTWVYAAFLRPLVRQHEPDIEEKLKDFRAKSADLLLFYIKNFTDQGKNLFLELMHMVVSQTPGSLTSREPSQRPEPSAPSQPITIRRSNHQASTAESGFYSEPRNMSVDFDELPLNPEVEEALRASHINLPRLRKKK